jgi:hypothetical protein
MQVMCQHALAWIAETIALISSGLWKPRSEWADRITTNRRGQIEALVVATIFRGPEAGFLGKFDED